jgi:hypothetical protein
MGVIARSVRTGHYEPDTKVLEIVNRETHRSGENFHEKQQVVVDNNGRTLEQLTSRWNSNLGDWEQFHKSSSSYHPDGALRSHEEYIWQDLKWVGQTKYTERIEGNVFEQIEYRYRDGAWCNLSLFSVKQNANGKVAESQRSSWNEARQEWSPTEKSSYTYIQDTLMTEQVTYHWNAGWVLTDKMARLYHSDRKSYEETTSRWENGETLPVNKKIRFFDKENHRSSDTLLRWEIDKKDWIPYEMLLNTWYENGREEGLLALIWDTSTQKWIDSRQIVYFYDGQGRISQEQHFSFGKDRSVSGYQDAYKYDKYGNRHLAFNTKLDQGTGVWTDDTRTEYSFYEDIDAADVKDRKGYLELEFRDNKHAVSEEKHYKTSEGKEQLVSHTKYYYSTEKATIE